MTLHLQADSVTYFPTVPRRAERDGLFRRRQRQDVFAAAYMNVFTAAPEEAIALDASLPAA